MADKIVPWSKVASQLDPMMPAEQYDELRNSYFYNHIAPRVSPAQHSYAKERFMAKTERPSLLSPVAKVVMPLSLAGMSMLEGMTAPLEVSEQTRGVHQYFKKQTEELVKIGKREGMPTAIPEIAGQLVGMGIPMGAAIKGAGMVTGPIIKAAMKGQAAARITQAMVRGGLGLGTYQALSDEHGNRLLAGAEGAAWGIGGEALFGLPQYLQARKLVKSLREGEEVATSVLRGEGGTAEQQAAVAEQLQKAATSEPMRARPETIFTKRHFIPGAPDQENAVAFTLQLGKNTMQEFAVPGKEEQLKKILTTTLQAGGKLRSVAFTESQEPYANDLLSWLGEGFEAKHGVSGTLVKTSPEGAERIAARLRAEGSKARAVGDDVVEILGGDEAYTHAEMSPQRFWEEAKDWFSKPEIYTHDNVVFHREAGKLLGYDRDIEGVLTKQSTNSRLKDMLFNGGNSTVGRAIRQVWDPKVDEAVKREIVAKLRGAPEEANLGALLPRRFREGYTGDPIPNHPTGDVMPSVDTIIAALKRVKDASKVPLEEWGNRQTVKLGIYHGGEDPIGQLMQSIRGMYSPFYSDFEKQALANHVGKFAPELVPGRFAEEAAKFREGLEMGGRFAGSEAQKAEAKAMQDEVTRLRQMLVDKGASPEMIDNEALIATAEENLARPMVDIVIEGRGVVASIEARALDAINRGLPPTEAGPEFADLVEGRATDQVRTHIDNIVRKRVPMVGVGTVRTPTGKIVERRGPHGHMLLTKAEMEATGAKGVGRTYGSIREAQKIFGPIQGLPAEEMEKPLTNIVMGQGRKVTWHESLHANLFATDNWGKNFADQLVGLDASTIKSFVQIAEKFKLLSSYGSKKLGTRIEEAFVHAAQAIRTGDLKKLDDLALLDTSVINIIRAVNQASRVVKAGLGNDRAAARILERKLDDLIRRTADQPFAIASRTAKQLNMSLSYNAVKNKWDLANHIGAKEFNTQKEMFDYFFEQSAADLMAPSVTGTLEQMGIRTADLADIPRMQGKAPLPDIGIDDTQAWRGWMAITGWIRPMSSWVPGLQGKMTKVMGRQAPDIYTPFREVDDQLRKGMGWLSGVLGEAGKVIGGLGGRLNEYTEVLGQKDWEKSWPKLKDALKLKDEDFGRIKAFEQWAANFRVDTSFKSEVTSEQIAASVRTEGIYKDFGPRMAELQRLKVSARTTAERAEAENAISKLLESVAQKRGTIPEGGVPTAATRQEGIDILNYLRNILPKLKQSNFNIEGVFPNKFDEKSASFWEKMLNQPQHGFQPADTHLGKLVMFAVRKGYEQKFTGEAIERLEKVLATKTKDGKNVIPSFLQAPLRRYVDYVRGVPDVSQQIINSTVKGFQQTLSNEFKRLNKALPAGAQLPTQFDAPQHVINRMMIFSYAFGLGLRPAIAVRDTLQMFMTTLPVTGAARFSGGLAKALTFKGWKEAEKAGALLTKANLEELYGDFTSEIPRGGKGLQQRLLDFSNKILFPSRWGHNISRATTYHAELGNYTKELEIFRNQGEDVNRLLKNTSLWFHEDANVSRILEMAKNRSIPLEQVAKTATLDTIDLTQWAYRRGMQPAALQTGVGRIFGQYGMWPMSYMDFLGRLTKKSFQHPEKALQMAGYWVAANAAAMKSMEMIGADVSKWLWQSPAGYGLSPHAEFIGNLLKAPEETDEGRKARGEVLKYPLSFVPSGLEIENVLKAMDADEGMFTGEGVQMTPSLLRILGFKPMKELEESPEWDEWLKEEAGFGKTRQY